MRELLADILFNLDSHLVKLGLEADQEKYIVNMVETAFNDTLSHITRSVSVSSSLDAIVRLLTNLVEHQRKLAEQSFANTETGIPEKDFPNDGETYSSDVELF